MKKTIICNIPMKEHVDLTVYSSDDRSLPAADRKVRYPVNAFLSETLSPEDELKVILLVKKDGNKFYEQNTQYFKQELEEANEGIGASIEYTVIDTEFKETKAVHEELLCSIVDALEENAHIIADVTYGPKDLVVVLFTALNFAEKFLNCSIDNIVYGQAGFADGKAVDTKICDMIPLFCLESLINTIHCDDPEKARKILRTLLTF